MSRLAIRLLAFVAVTITAGRVMSPQDARPRAVRRSPHIPKSPIVEIGISPRNAGHATNQEFDLNVVLFSPRGTQKKINGFYDAAKGWRLRVAPDEAGLWTYDYRLVRRDGVTVDSGNGQFSAMGITQSAAALDAAAATNGNGLSFFPIGIQDCIAITGNQLNPIAIDGKLRTDPEYDVSVSDYLRIYGSAGFNLFRFSQQNCSFDMYDDLDHYRQDSIEATDELLSLAHQNGFHIMFGFFGYYNGYHQDWEGGPAGPDVSAQEKRFVSYCVARWGVYVDIWELLNERSPPDSWAQDMAAFVHSIDPENRPVSTSWERPYVPAIDVDSPHWYESEDELESDLRVQQQAQIWKSTGKMVVVGEQGNTGMNWDPRSATRMRIRLWTSWFEGIGLVFWNVSWSMFGVNQGIYVPGSVANIYLGPEERGYTSILRSCASQFPVNMTRGQVTLSAPDQIRAYAMYSDTSAVVYLQHSATHDSAMPESQIRLDFPLPPAFGTTYSWLDPATGAIQSALPGDSPGWLRVPSFTVDCALIIKYQTRRWF